ncbi:nuclear transport factor 2 family protein [Sphingosinicella rhizophila]|uniref:Nuclear transport factor 2 family protein n=1 Tax=Sphingosinicella rhizophila TaxID=3050082 RepID=A0ABU3Q657_9SPHN|nr:nuclear transport factor 2 family protein [Sphingosinicella sp. GR2756]MDT9598797.1 nuclear transport factor 2 family protein [Sphingosinicella sp. GR2756]
MNQPDRSADEARILEIVDTMFDAISWSEGSPPDFDRFSAAVMAEAVLVPAARPAATTDIASFVKRMSGLHADGAMKTFTEKATKTQIRIFGNIAVAIGGFEAIADGSPGRGANVFLLVRDAGDWRIAAMAWDNESVDNPLPEDLG